MDAVVNDSDNKRRSEDYLETALLGVAILLVTKWFWPSIIPFELFEFWVFKESYQDVLVTSWPLLAWGALLAIALHVNDRKEKIIEEKAEALFIAQAMISVKASIVEEICFRWLIFYAAIVIYQLFDPLFLGLLSYLHLRLMGPIANLLTLGYLEPFLFSKPNWAIGAAIVSSNFKFREAHSYQRFTGYVNSWFLGMYFFYVMFKHGLLAGMLVHFLYNMTVFFVAYLENVIGRAILRRRNRRYRKK